MEKVLNGHRIEDQTVDAVFALAAHHLGEGAVALLTSAGAFEVLHITEGRWHPAPGRRFDTAGVFEVRAFNDGVGEVRWLHEAAGRGPAVIVGPGVDVVAGASTDVSRRFLETIPSTGVLWGSAVRSDGAWTEVHEARVAPFWIPLEGAPLGTRIQLHSVEYVAVDQHGNAHVIDEILSRFEAIASEGHR